MYVTRENGVLTGLTAVYRLTFAPDRRFVYVDDSAGVRLAELFVLVFRQSRRLDAGTS